MKKACVILILVMTLGLPALGAEKQPASGLTAFDLLTAQRQTIVERMQKLDAQYRLSQMELTELNAKIAAETAKAKEDKGK